MHKEQRSRSSSPLRDSVVPQHTDTGTTSSYKTGGHLNEILKTLQMTKINDASDSSSSDASTNTIKAKESCTPNSRSHFGSRSRSNSDPGPYGAAETVSLTRQKRR